MDGERVNHIVGTWMQLLMAKVGLLGAGIKVMVDRHAGQSHV